ncbi:DUF2951 domain-containing protein [Staphylococcus aureus]|nr:DUF2951 domain-containing protein [Staphylococcus aureus]
MKKISEQKDKNIRDMKMWILGLIETCFR